MDIKKSMLLVSVAVAALASSMTAFAEDKTPGSGPNPYADCGIGASLFTETKWAAVTSNVIWDVGTTAITSATSSPQTCSGKKIVAAMFINDTYDKLTEETAAGKGEHLATVLNIFGCDGAHQSVAAQQVRAAMGQSVAAPDYVDQSHLDKASNYYSIVEHAVIASCPA